MVVWLIRLSPMRDLNPNIGVAQLICLSKSDSNGPPKHGTYFAYRRKGYAKKHHDSSLRKSLCPRPLPAPSPSSPAPRACASQGRARPRRPGRSSPAPSAAGQGRACPRAPAAAGPELPRARARGGRGRAHPRPWQPAGPSSPTRARSGALRLPWFHLRELRRLHLLFAFAVGVRDFFGAVFFSCA